MATRVCGRMRSEETRVWLLHVDQKLKACRTYAETVAAIATSSDRVHSLFN